MNESEIQTTTLIPQKVGFWRRLSRFLGVVLLLALVWGPQVGYICYCFKESDYRYYACYSRYDFSDLRKQAGTDFQVELQRLSWNHEVKQRVAEYQQRRGMSVLIALLVQIVFAFVIRATVLSIRAVRRK